MMRQLWDSPIWQMPKVLLSKIMGLFKKKEGKIEKPKRGRPKKK
tara:strand:+ start:824 stop:955 length:132 start_codon:yes stop_codon:yes gene_type:complete